MQKNPVKVFDRNHASQTGAEQKGVPALVKKIGKTICVVRVYFSETGRGTVNDKIKRMFGNEFVQM